MVEQWVRRVGIGSRRHLSRSHPFTVIRYYRMGTRQHLRRAGTRYARVVLAASRSPFLSVLYRHLTGTWPDLDSDATLFDHSNPWRDLVIVLENIPQVLKAMRQQIGAGITYSPSPHIPRKRRFLDDEL